MGETESITYHPTINGRPCDETGNFLPQDAPPPPWNHPDPTDWTPFQPSDPDESGRINFELADLLYRRDEMPASNIKDLMQFWAARERRDPPFANTEDLYNTIDSIPLGDVPWQSFTVKARGPNAGLDGPSWKRKAYDVWYRDPREVLKAQLGNPDFAHEMDFAPKEVRNTTTGDRRYGDFMSGQWSWRQADKVAEKVDNHGSTLCPIILGSDKTVVSVGTGNTEYYPLYMSNGLIHNNVRRAHRGGMTLIAFLAIPKADRDYADADEFRDFRRHIFHGSLREILQSLCAGMDQYELLRYGDGYYRRTIYTLGPYIADYPEQVLLACIVSGWCAKCQADANNLDFPRAPKRSHILTDALMDCCSKQELWDDHGIISDIMPFTHGFPRADIHELISPDLLHQIIKGTFKDHLVTWLEAYLVGEHGPTEADRRLADIDRRIRAAPPFPNLWRFPVGRRFKQWTGDDSKALMKVFLPAISGHVEPEMVLTVQFFLEFCYLVRRSVLEDSDLEKLDQLLDKFHQHRTIFETEGVRHPQGNRSAFSLPRQHSLIHYCTSIMEFGAPNGLCSSITESQHIEAVKKPWRRSNKFNALGQMILSVQRTTKLKAARINFQARGMMDGSLFDTAEESDSEPEDEQLAHAQVDAEDDDGDASDCKDILGEVKLALNPVRNISRNIITLSQELGFPHLPFLVSRFLSQQAMTSESESDSTSESSSDDDDDDSPVIAKIWTYPSAVATFYAPSDRSGVQGMYRERIRSVASWREGPPRYDCVFVEQDSQLPGFRGLLVARVKLFFKVKLHDKKQFPCALVNWYSTIGDAPSLIRPEKKE
ncbi:hypothetical protein BDN72DRAFT_873109 [Pluteus cervinus]|uniref:Uncharacterized protein n=1 Tax=Pluteus cervinus TaxID=181527 RepID=A0ACD2ZZY3_9AGAR|nr:hypothetical protein BDN72DRAFT_873109 [Pluteus cervinus]